VDAGPSGPFFPVIYDCSVVSIVKKHWTLCVRCLNIIYSLIDKIKRTLSTTDPKARTSIEKKIDGNQGLFFFAEKGTGMKDGDGYGVSWCSWYGL
jgi:hypothetical protein